MESFNTIKAREAFEAIAAHGVEYKDWSAIIGELPMASVLYLLQYGFAQTLQDAAAGADDKAAKMNGRLAALRDGTVGTGRTGPRMAGLDKIAWDIAVDAVRAAYGAKKAKWPAKTDEVKAIVQPIFDANHDRWLEKARAKQAELAEMANGLNINL